MFNGVIDWSPYTVGNAISWLITLNFTDDLLTIVSHKVEGRDENLRTIFYANLSNDPNSFNIYTAGSI